MSFLPPLTLEHAEDWWRSTISPSHSGAIFLVARDAERIVGSVQLHPAWAPNQPHRADTAKLLVHRRGRCTGLGTRIMQVIEDAAQRAGFSLLTLDTKRGDAADPLYRQIGWTAAGTIPGYALDRDGTPHDTVIFYKELTMETNLATPKNIDEYIAGFPNDVQEILERIRKTIKEAAPDTQEAIKYQMPTFTLKGNLVHFAAFKSHIGFYPVPTGIEAFRDELAVYKQGKGSVQFPLDQPIPYDLISKIVAFRVQENLAQAFRCTSSSTTLADRSPANKPASPPTASS